MRRAQVWSAWWPVGSSQACPQLRHEVVKILLPPVRVDAPSRGVFEQLAYRLACGDDGVIVGRYLADSFLGRQWRCRELLVCQVGDVE
jgi:hypothetical protein